MQILSKPVLFRSESSKTFSFSKLNQSLSDENIDSILNSWVNFNSSNDLAIVSRDRYNMYKDYVKKLNSSKWYIYPSTPSANPNNMNYIIDSYEDKNGIYFLHRVDSMGDASWQDGVYSYINNLSYEEMEEIITTNDLFSLMFLRENMNIHISARYSATDVINSVVYLYREFDQSKYLGILKQLSETFSNFKNKLSFTFNRLIDEVNSALGNQYTQDQIISVINLINTLNLMNFRSNSYWTSKRPVSPLKLSIQLTREKKVNFSADIEVLSVHDDTNLNSIKNKMMFVINTNKKFKYSVHKPDWSNLTYNNLKLLIDIDNTKPKLYSMRSSLLNASESTEIGNLNADQHYSLISTNLLEDNKLYINNYNQLMVNPNNENGSVQQAVLSYIAFSNDLDEFILKSKFQITSSDKLILTNIIELEDIFIKTFSTQVNKKKDIDLPFRTIELMDLNFKLYSTVQENFTSFYNDEIISKINKEIILHPKADLFWNTPVEHLNIENTKEFINFISQLKLKTENIRDLKDGIYQVLSMYGNYRIDGDFRVTEFLSGALNALEESLTGITTGLTDLTNQNNFNQAYNALDEITSTYVDILDEGMEVADIKKDWDNPKFDDFMLNNQMKIANMRNQLQRRHYKTNKDVKLAKEIQLLYLTESSEEYSDSKNVKADIQLLTEYKIDQFSQEIDTIASKSIEKMDVPLPTASLQWLGDLLMNALGKVIVAVFNTISIVENMLRLMNLAETNFSVNERAKLIFDDQTHQTYTLVSFPVHKVLKIRSSQFNSMWLDSYKYVDKEAIIPKYLTSSSIITKSQMLYSLIPVDKERFNRILKEAKGESNFDKLHALANNKDVDKIYCHYKPTAHENLILTQYMWAQSLAAAAAAAANTPGIIARAIAAAIASNVVYFTNVVLWGQHNSNLSYNSSGKGKEFINTRDEFFEPDDNFKKDLDSLNTVLVINDLNALSITNGSNARIAWKMVKEIAAIYAGWTMSVVVSILIGKATKWVASFKERWALKRKMNRSKTGKINVKGKEIDISDLSDYQRSLIARNASADLLTDQGKDGILDNVTQIAGDAASTTIGAITDLTSAILGQKDKYKDSLTKKFFNDHFTNQESKLDKILENIGSLAADGMILMLLRRINKKLGF